jgi:hypothetical protein
MRHIVIALVTALLLAAAFTLGAIGQQNILPVSFAPLALTLDQTVPLTLTVNISPSKTVTIPAKLKLALTVQLEADGALAAREVTAVPIPAATATVADAPPPAASDGPSTIQIGPIQWQITDARDIGNQVQFNSQYSQTTSGKMIWLDLNIENTGNIPFNGYDVDYTMIDSRGRIFAELGYERSYSERCNYTDVNPGLNKACFAVFDLPADATGLILTIETDDGYGEMRVMPLPAE